MKAVVVYSGGLDSFTLLHVLRRRQKSDIHAFSVDYNQRHSKELTVAMRVCDDLGIPHRIMNAGTLLLSDSALVCRATAVPEGHYAADNMRQTVVPNRNATLLLSAAAYAASIGANRIYYGAHAGDHRIYRDCRPAFVDAMNTLLYHSMDEYVSVSAPFIHASKAEIVRKGLTLGIDYSKTWTCYRGAKKACGKCGACVERLEAFEACGTTDPMVYSDE